jgi:hypothetical protein
LPKISSSVPKVLFFALLQATSLDKDSVLGHQTASWLLLLEQAEAPVDTRENKPLGAPGGRNTHK